MKNVVLASSSAQQPTGSTVTTTLPRLLSAARGEAALSAPPETDAVWETAIEGGVRIRNETQYWVDAADILSGGLALTLPAFDFDGEGATEIACDGRALSVSYKGWTCRYSTDGEIVDTGGSACNRNGRYRVFEARGKDSLKVQISIEPQRACVAGKAAAERR